MIREKTVKLTQAPDFRVGITASMETGRYVVELRADNGHDDGALMTPAQALALSRALESYASHADLAQQKLRRSLRRKP